MKSDKIQKAREFANDAHGSTNQMYDGGPYFNNHIEPVVEVCKKYLYLIADDEQEDVVCALYLHDVIENCRVTYGDLKKEFGEKVADIVYNVSSEMGKNRKERNERTYPKIAQCPLSVFVKLCDRIANSTYDIEGSMFKKYKEEYEGFRKALFPSRGARFVHMWNSLENLYEDN